MIVPTIAAPFQNKARCISQPLHYLKGLKLAQPLSEENSFEISLLIEADHFWDLHMIHVLTSHKGEDHDIRRFEKLESLERKVREKPDENPQRIHNIPYQPVTKDSTQIKNVSDCRSKK